MNVTAECILSLYVNSCRATTLIYQPSSVFHTTLAR